jgi:glyoxylate/hydroxypyruvate reductase
MKIVICCPSAKEAARWAALVQEKLPLLGLSAQILALQAETDTMPEADYAIGWRPHPEFFARHPRLKAFFNMGAGLDYFFDNPAMVGKVPDHVPIIRLEDAGMAQQMTDYCRHQVMEWMYDFARYRDQQARRVWRGWRERYALDRSQMPVGVLGLGKLGSAVASAFASDGFKVSGFATSPKHIEGVHFEGEFARFMAASRVLIVLAPATPQTRHIVRAETLALMPKNSYIINLARGALVNESELLSALDSGQLAGACLDVFDIEPLPVESPLWAHPKVVVTPHSSAPTLMQPAADQILSKLQKMISFTSVTGSADRSKGY